MGEAFKDKLMLYARDAKVFPAPAFRYQWLWQPRPAAGAGSDAVLVLLPIDRHTACFIVELVFALERNCPFIVKEHPALRLAELDTLRAAPRDDLRIDTGPTPELLDQASVVVCGGGTTAGLEALASGLPVIFVAPPGRLMDVDVPREVATGMYAIAQDREALGRTVAEFRACRETHGGRWRALGSSLKERFFVRNDSALLRRLVGCRQGSGESAPISE